MPFSLRGLPKSEKDFVVENDFSALCFTLGLNSDFKEAIAAVKKQTSDMKQSIYPYGVNALTQLIAWFPGIVGQLVMMWVVSKATVVVSNVPLAKKGLKYQSLGLEAVGFVGLIPGLGDLAFGISATSMGERLYIGIQSDEAYLQNPRELRDIVDLVYKEQL